MAGNKLFPSRGGPPASNPPLRKSILPRSTPGRESRGGMGRTEDGTSAAIGGQADKVQGEHPGAVLPSRLETGNSSNPGGHNGEWRDDGFNGQNFGGFEEGYFEGHNGYGNGYGSMNRGNFRQHPYRQQWNRGYNNSFRGGNNRFNGGGNRYQRRFNNNENPMTFPGAKSAATTQMVASASGETEGSLGMQNMDTSSVDHLVNPSSSRAQKKLDKVLCLRCGENGHFSDSCSAALCLYCEKTSHASKECPLLYMPKPVAVTYGVSRNELMFHEVPASSDVTFKHDSGKVGKISITGGSLEPQEIVKELKWIIPGNHQWDLRPTEDGAFKALFPSKSDLARMTKIINVPVPETSMFLHFEEWSVADLDRFYFSQVEGDQGKGKVDAVMHDANPDDDPENKKDKVKEAPKGVDTNSGITKPTVAPNPIQPKTNNVPPKQDHASLSMIRVGRIDCHNTPKIAMPFWSESRVMDLAPRRLWGASDNDDEDSLPSPLQCLSL
ncbi:hypothetical protein ACQ4PT_007240 [Festuca glaucescens]